MDALDSGGDIARKAPTPYEIGRQGEIAAGIDLTEPKKHIQINGRTRIPDKMTGTELIEVKNVKYISNTCQLRDFADYARQENLQLILKVNKNTRVANTVIAAGWQIIRFD